VLSLESCGKIHYAPERGIMLLQDHQVVKFRYYPPYAPSGVSQWQSIPFLDLRDPFPESG